MMHDATESIKNISFSCCLCLCGVTTPINVSSKPETIEVYCGNGHPHLITIQDGWITAITLNIPNDQIGRAWVLWKIEELLREHKSRKITHSFEPNVVAYENGFIDCAESLKKTLELVE